MNFILLDFKRVFDYPFLEKDKKSKYNLSDIGNM